MDQRPEVVGFGAQFGALLTGKAHRRWWNPWSEMAAD
jgi:hypothetical protein